jgi:hypothetical protein
MSRSQGKPPDRVGRAEVDQINIIARWIHHHSEEETRAFFHLPPDLEDVAAAAVFVETVSDAIPRALAEPPAPVPPDVLEPLDADEMRSDIDDPEYDD